MNPLLIHHIGISILRYVICILQYNIIQIENDSDYKVYKLSDTVNISYDIYITIHIIDTD